MNYFLSTLALLAGSFSLNATLDQTSTKTTKGSMQHSALHQEMFKRACASMANAYEPYSNYKVGAALYTSTGKIVSGCNVENVSYGLSICAERNAITTMVNECGNVKIVEVMIVVSSNTFSTSCGACRQFLAEFATPETRINLGRHTDDGGFEIKSFLLKDLLPHNFAHDMMEPDLYEQNSQ